MSDFVDLPDDLRDYLGHPSLTPLWTRVRDHLERHRLVPSGAVTVHLDEDAARRLQGLVGPVGRRIAQGQTRIRVPEIDAALRRSAAAAGVVSVLSALHGPLIDRSARREQRDVAWSVVWEELDGGLAAAGLAEAPWAPDFLEGLRRSGILTRAGVLAATVAVRRSAATFRVATVAAVLKSGESATEPCWELGELAHRVAGDAHGLDADRLAAALVLRAIAAATGLDPPVTVSARHRLWEAVGVTPDAVSGTVLVWGLRPPGDGRWALMMRERADLGLVTHLTAHELRAAAGSLARPGSLVHACENPQVLQAASRASVPATLVCFSGNPASAGRTLLERLVADGSFVTYHGDFDWAGIRIAKRVFQAGAAPWRLSSADYSSALRDLPEGSRLALDGDPTPTPWDPVLESRMRAAGVAVHEEAVLPALLEDLSFSR